MALDRSWLSLESVEAGCLICKILMVKMHVEVDC